LPSGCAWAVTDHTLAAPLISVMKSRLRIVSL
jgi:hypothetical protein